MTPSCRLKTALPTPLVSPLCQKPPSPMTAIERFLALLVPVGPRGPPRLLPCLIPVGPERPPDSVLTALLASCAVEGRVGRGAEAIAHGRAADVEGRQDREEVAADVARHLVLAELLLDELHGREDRPLRAAGAEAGRADRDLLLQLLQVLVDIGGRLVRRPQPVGKERRHVLAEERRQRRRSRTFAVYSPAIGSGPLPTSLAPTSALRRIFASACSM